MGLGSASGLLGGHRTGLSPAPVASSISNCSGQNLLDFDTANAAQPQLPLVPSTPCSSLSCLSLVERSCCAKLMPWPVPAKAGGGVGQGQHGPPVSYPLWGISLWASWAVVAMAMRILLLWQECFSGIISSLCCSCLCGSPAPSLSGLQARQWEISGSEMCSTVAWRQQQAASLCLSGWNYFLSIRDPPGGTSLENKT